MGRGSGVGQRRGKGKAEGRVRGVDGLVDGGLIDADVRIVALASPSPDCPNSGLCWCRWKPAGSGVERGVRGEGRGEGEGGGGEECMWTNRWIMVFCFASMYG